jgi:hypothetical protein
MISTLPRSKLAQLKREKVLTSSRNGLKEYLPSSSSCPWSKVQIILPIHWCVFIVLSSCLRYLNENFRKEFRDVILLCRAVGAGRRVRRTETTLDSKRSTWAKETSSDIREAAVSNHGDEM